jgi:large subunit ribosomal protein L17
LYERITTTEAKAKEMRSKVDRIISRARRGTLADRRFAVSQLTSPLAVSKLFEETREVYKDRTSGFTRITKLGPRVGDAAPMVMVELVDYNPIRKKKEPKAEVTVETAPEATTKVDKPVAKKPATRKPRTPKAKQEVA